MEVEINDLGLTFNKIVGLKNDNEKKIIMLESKTKHLKDIYNEFIKHNNEILCVFSLDSLHFQSKIIDVEYDDMKRLFSCILNRMYCEFFKLYKIITEYIRTNINDKKIKELLNIHNQYPVYKDLEPFKVYDFEIIESIHNVILELLHSLVELYLSKEDELIKYQNKNKFGFNIDNFVNTIMFNNTMLREKIRLFVNYLFFFHKLQIKYLTRYIHKVELVISQLDNDIDFEERKETNEYEDEYTIEEDGEYIVDKVKKLLYNDYEDELIKRETSVYKVEYNSELSSLDGNSFVDFVEVPTEPKELSNSKKETQLSEENIELTVEESPSTEENNEGVV